MSKFSKLLITALAAVTFGGALACSSSQSETAKVEPIKVTVSTNFEPKTIEVKKGQPVKLIFFRKDGENCGDEVSFPNLNIKKNLPVGEEVPVEFTPQETGEIAFTCGMNMMRGKVVVQ